MFSITIGCIEENGFSIAPPHSGSMLSDTVCIFQDIACHMMNVNVLYSRTISHPDTYTSGTVLYHTVTQDYISDISMCLCSDLECRVMRIQNTVADDNIFTCSIPLCHGLRCLDYNGIIPCLYQTSCNQNILTAVRINTIIICTSDVIEYLNILHSHMMTASHMQRPECRILNRNVPDCQIGDILQKCRSWSECCHTKRTLMCASIHIIIYEYLITLSVDNALTGYGDIFLMACKKETAAIPAGTCIVILKELGKIHNILLVQTADQDCPLLQMEVYVAL